MANYELRFKKSVPKDLETLPKRDVERIVKAIRALCHNPRPPQAIKMTREEKYRLRCGDYRVLYEIKDAVLLVTIVKVGHRRDIYRR